MATQTQTKAAPVKNIRIGQVEVAIWANESKSGTFYRATASRSYKDEQGNFKSSDSFGSSDLQNLRKALDLAHDWMLEHRQSKGEEAPF
jgi:hypothetical protein